MFSAAIKTAAAAGGYQISRSLRFNSADSAYLNRTPASAGNRRTWTWSGWVKISSLSSTNGYLFTTTDADINNATYIYLNGNTLRYWDNTGSGGAAVLTTSAVYRDVSAWYHIVLAVDTTQATSSNRARLYVNGVEVTAFSTANYPAQNTNSYVNDTVAHYIGAPTRYFNGYMTEVNFIDGQALTPSSFGETNAQTGVWQPKAYSGSYGTNGFYLNFSDNSNTTAATLGKDYSGNGNNWTPNNFSVSAGAGNDSLVDTPTPYGVDTGAGGNVRGNYCTNNPLDTYTGLTSANGNLDLNYTTSETAWRASRATIGVSSGKWYWEVLCNNVAAPSGDPRALLGIMTSRASLASFVGSDAFGWGYYSHGDKYTNGSGSGGGIASYQAGDLIGFAFDADAGTLTFYKNGSSVTSFTGLSANTYFPAFSLYGSNAGSISINFGQRPFAYTAPSGYKALCTQNLPTPTIGATTATQAGNYFIPTTYTGNGSSSRAISNGINMAANGGLVWTKQRSGVEWHFLIDNVRGNTKYLSSNATNAEGTISTLVTSFDSTGYSIGNDSGINSNGSTYVSWVWGAGGSGVTNTAGSITSTVSANTTSGFSIVTYTGDGLAGATVGHGLGVVPKMVIVKARYTSGASWLVFTDLTTQSSGSVYTSSVFNIGSKSGGVLGLNLTNATFSYTMDYQTNANGGTYVAYCFAEVPGYSKFGSYTGNGSTDGPFVYCGFRPKYVLVKRSDNSFGWWVFDGVRSPYNAVDKYLSPDLSDAEYTANIMDFTSNGFKIRETSQGWNGSGGAYIFAAFAEFPQKFSLAR